MEEKKKDDKELLGENMRGIFTKLLEGESIIPSEIEVTKRIKLTKNI